MMTSDARSAVTLPGGLRSIATVPGDRDYVRLQHTYTYRGAPGLVLSPRTSDEVAAALAWARTSDLPLAIRSGGHGISSRSTNDGGVVIDLGNLHAVEILDRPSRRVRIDAGARWGQVASRLVPSGLAVSSGDSGDVGVGGLVTAGGIGLLGRRHGLTIDHVVAATVVTADGRVVEASADEHADLFWAVRGAGANVGIVTHVDVVAAEVDSVVHAQLTYDGIDLPALLEAWGAVMSEAPRDVTGFLYVFPPRPGANVMASIVVTSTDASAAARLLRPFTAVAPVMSSRVRLVPYDAVVATTATRHTGATPRVSRSALLPALTSDLAAAMDLLMSNGAAEGLHLRAVGGAINDVPSQAMAYSHRHHQFSAMAFADADLRDQLWRGWEAIHALADGLYLSFETDRDPQRLLDAFPPATLERLRHVKRRWDPDNVFRQNFAITP